MRRRWMGLLSCAALAGACGGAPTLAAGPLAVVSTGPQPAERVPPSGRVASEVVKRRWIFTGGTEIAIYADLQGLLRTELFRGVAQAALALGGDSLSPRQKDCVNQLLVAAREVAAGARGDQRLLILRFEPSAMTAPGACLRAAEAVHRIELSGADEAYADDESVFALLPGLLLLGSKPEVLAALSGPPGTWPPELGLVDDQYLTWTGVIEQRPIRGALSASAERFQVAGEATMRDEDEARVAEKLASGQRLDARITQLPPEVAATARRLVEAWHVTRRGRDLVAVFELREPPVDQARDIGVMAALAIGSLREYLTAAKISEARSAVAQIAGDYVAAWDATPPAKRRLVSLPPVPREVPRGRKVQSAPSDWKAWAPIHFSISDPQYYQYQVVAAKDGQSVEIVARGDLDGDGKSSRFSLRLVVDRKTRELRIEPNVQEVDPAE